MELCEPSSTWTWPLGGGQGAHVLPPHMDSKWSSQLHIHGGGTHGAMDNMWMLPHVMHSVPKVPVPAYTT